MLHNLNKEIFPNAKVIHCVRNSKDNCLSIFTNYFVNPKLNFAYDENELLQFYNLYNDLMFFWKSKFRSDCIPPFFTSMFSTNFSS